MHHIYMRYPGGRAKCLTLSYDDCVQQDMRLCALMRQYGIAGTFNVNSGVYVSEDHVFEAGRVHRRMTKGQSSETFGSSPLFEVATHGYTHPYLDKLPAAQTTFEVLADRRAIEAQFGTICRGHAYPYGTYDQQVMNCLRACGIVYARTIRDTGAFTLPEDFLQWHPTCHHDDPKLTELTDQFLAPVKKDSRLFYLWGHSFEFEENNNWQVIEDFFKKVAGQEDVWYATNIQIYDYVQAYRQLIWSADCGSVYNPTATDLWLQAGKVTLCVPAGKRVTL